MHTETSIRQTETKPLNLFRPQIDLSTLTRMTRTVLLSLIILAAGCLRYTPSHDELIEQKSGDSETPIQFGGKEEFQKHEDIIEQRLQHFIAQRSSDATESPTTGHPLQVGDSISVTVFGFNNLTTNATLSPDGHIHLPLIGPINVLGMAPERAQSNLKSRYSHFIKNPEVGIKVENQRTLNVSILGSVHKPGPYPLAHSGNFLTEILSEAGGRTPQAGTRIILLPSQKAYQGFGNQTPVETLSQENSRLVEVDFEQLTGTTTTPPIRIPLRPGDTIIIPEAGTYEVDGEVAQPGSYKLTSRTSVMGAIAAARGLTYAASVNNIELIRDVGGGKKALISLDLEAVGLRGARDIRLRTGDLVRVPSEPKKFFKQQIVQAINGLFNGVGVNQRLN
jgi:polysaccharide export outer membrane protein